MHLQEVFMSDSDPGATVPSADLQIRKRPVYLTVIAVGLVIWGVVLTALFVPKTVAIVTSGKGPLLLVLFMLYMHSLWICIAAAGIGIFRAARWSRWLLVGALVGLLASTLIKFEFSGLIEKEIVYGLLVLALFTGRADDYFSPLAADKLAPVAEAPRDGLA